MSGIITGPYFDSYFHLSDVQLGSVVAILEIGALSKPPNIRYMLQSYWPLIVTSIASGRIGDMIGRKMTLFWGALIFTIGGAIQTFTNGLIMMFAGRLISGFGVGLLSWVLLLQTIMLMIHWTFPISTIVPIYQSEISPPNHVRCPTI